MGEQIVERRIGGQTLEMHARREDYGKFAARGALERLAGRKPLPVVHFDRIDGGDLIERRRRKIEVHVKA